jgi:putative PIN family toxin of toxin-antitoxin system
VTPGPRVVYDCNIFVQALISPRGPAARCIELARDGNASLFVTDFILTEIRESYLKTSPKFGLTQQKAESLAIAIASISTMISNPPERFVYSRDPDDAHYVNVALAADAKLVVSRDRDLLDLMDATTGDGAAFTRQYPELAILDPVQFIRLVVPSAE